MLCGHHPGWYNRFIIHDHYQRLFAGVHDLDDGGFEYFFHWLGVGMIPWVALVPTAVATTLARLRRRLSGDPQRRFELLLLLWATLGFFLFSKSSTKFHHYIFPVVPPIALLASLHITRLARGRLRFHVPMIAIAIGTLIWVGKLLDALINTPRSQHRKPRGLAAFDAKLCEFVYIQIRTTVVTYASESS